MAPAQIVIKVKYFGKIVFIKSVPKVWGDCQPDWGEHWGQGCQWSYPTWSWGCLCKHTKVSGNPKSTQGFLVIFSVFFSGFFLPFFPLSLSLSLSLFPLYLSLSLSKSLSLLLLSVSIYASSFLSVSVLSCVFGIIKALLNTKLIPRLHFFIFQDSNARWSAQVLPRRMWSCGVFCQRSGQIKRKVQISFYSRLCTVMKRPFSHPAQPI